MNLCSGLTRIFVPVFGVSDKITHKPVTTNTEISLNTKYFIEKVYILLSRKANRKRADQSARMRRLICAFAVRMQKVRFSRVISNACVRVCVRACVCVCGGGGALALMRLHDVRMCRLV